MNSNYSNYTDFTNADLTSISTFVATNLSYSKFTGATLTDTNLSTAILTGVVSGAVTFKDATATTTYHSTYAASTATPPVITTNDGGPLLPPNWLLVKGYLVGPKADLTSAFLSGTPPDTTSTPHTLAVLTYMQNIRVFGADFTGADLSYVDFTDSSLARCNFTGAILTGTKFTNCNLEDCIFSGTQISTDTVFTATNLNGVMSGEIIDATTKDNVSTSGLTYSTQLPTSWSFKNGYIVGPGAVLFNAKLA